LTKLGTYLVLKKIWNHVDFQGHRSNVKVTGSNLYARGYAMLCVALVQHESPFKFVFSINFQNIILKKHITNSNIFFTLIDGRGIGITCGTQITFTFLEFFFFFILFSSFFVCMNFLLKEKVLNKKNSLKKLTKK